MADAADHAHDEDHSRREKIQGFIKGELLKGKDELTKGKLKLENSLGPGPLTHGPLSWHPVAGFAGKWFAEKKGLGKLIILRRRRIDVPIRRSIGRSSSGSTRMSSGWSSRRNGTLLRSGRLDLTTRLCGKPARWAIFQMREKQPAYNLITNNCQIYALKLLDAIQVGKHREFATSEAIKSPSKVVSQAEELPDDDHEKEWQEGTTPRQLAGERPTMSARTRWVMKQNTTHVDNRHSFWHQA
ncbi:hypothetical protein FB45DRAFT_868134 [Roridomyces roridus]|uniref:Uncharacterized protein n=1 Tax=Roridomyces roridus TaxID=1738132 RepID=A0AAD7FJ46_9AGAR|nr:hypothetical protein FB45DRAFT_868134 [Roridomyces roridus]